MRLPRYRLLSSRQRWFVPLWVRAVVIALALFCSFLGLACLLLASNDLTQRENRLLARIELWRGRLASPELENCQIPFIDPDDQVILNDWFRQEKECICTGKRHFFSSELRNGVSCIRFDKKVLRNDYSATSDDLSCSYATVRSNLSKSVWTNTFEFSEMKSLPLNACIDEELIYVKCSIKQEVYEQPLFHVGKVNTAKNEFYEPKWNILVLGVDALSRMTFHRTMQATKKSIKQIYGRNAVELKAYNKIGLNSAPNQIPMLTGKQFKHELNMINGEYFDDFGRFLWQDFKDAGYNTLFAEEQMTYGLFNYPRRKGFKKIPTDFWPRALMILRDKLRTRQTDSGCQYCYGGEHISATLLKYWTQIQLVNPNPTFSYLWLSESTHDELAGGFNIDNVTSNFLQEINQSGLANNTLILLLADHGFRMGPFRNSPLGSVEDMLPFGFFLIPESYAGIYPEDVETLKLNSERLVTAYDIHATLQELAIRFGDNEFDRNGSYAGQSLISTIVPIDRTCMDAKIDPEFCSCYASRPIDVQDVHANLADEVIRSVNRYLKKHNLTTKCQQIGEGRLEHASILSSKGNSSEFIKVVVSATPAPVSYEAFFEIRNDSYRLNGIPERLDRYDKHSSCAEGYHFAKYCYCM